MPRLLLLAFVLCCAPAAAAQHTNAEALGSLAADCLATVPAPGAFALVAPGLAPYLRDALVARWQTENRRVFADTSASAMPRLTLDAPAATIGYTRAGRRRYARSVGLRMGYVLTSAEGEVLRAGTCAEDAADTLDARDLDRIENPAFPETVGMRPPPGWVRRYAEPVVLGAAVVVSTVLFFSLRSR